MITDPDADLCHRAQKQLGRRPMRFVVDDYGTIELANHIPATDRFTAYDVSPCDLEMGDGFHDLLDRIQHLRSEIFWFSREIRSEETALQDWETDMVFEFIDTLTPDELAALKADMLAWFARDIDLEERESNDIVRPLDGRQFVYQLFAHSVDADILEALGIVVVEAEHPGSTYFAAELEKPVGEANQVASQLGLPILFQRGVPSP